MLLRHTLLYLPAQLLAPLAQFVAAVVWTHWLTPEDYGVLTFLVAAQDLVFVVCLSWWSAFCLRYFAGFDRRELDEYARGEATVLVLTVAFGAIVSIGLLAYLGFIHDSGLVVVAVVFLASRSIDVHFAERSRAQERILDYTVAQTAGPVVGFALSLVGVYMLAVTPATMLSGFAIAQCAAALWLCRRLDVSLSLQLPDAAMIRRALAYGVPMVLGGAFGWVSLNAVRFVAQEMGGDVAMGLLAVGWSLGQRMAGVTAMLVTAAAFPLAVRRMATHSRADAMRQFGAGGTLLFGLVAPAAAGLWLVSPLLVNLAVAEPFRPLTLAILPASILTGAVRNVRLHYADQSFLLFERTKYTILVNVAEAFAVVVLAMIGYRLHGLPGTVEGCLVATVLAALSVFALARVKFGLPLPLADWGRIALGTAVMCAGVKMAQAVGGPEWLRLVFQIGVGVAVYGLAMAALFFRETQGWRTKLLAVAPSITARR